MKKWAINTFNIKNGNYVRYVRGAKGTLIGKTGYVIEGPDEDGIVMVEFYCDETYPCLVGSLDRIE